MTDRPAIPTDFTAASIERSEPFIGLAAAREAVRSRFLLARLMADWLDLIAAFEPGDESKGGFLTTP
jgi:hypothetical protein